jgi:FAD synthetase
MNHEVDHLDNKNRFYRVDNGEDDPTELCVISAEKILRKALEMYSWQGLALSFNGGKDGTVILHLYYNLLQACPKIREEMQTCHEKIKIMDILPATPFEEVNEFVEICRIRYNLEVFKMTTSLREGLGQFIKSYPSVKAIIMGVRRGDPGASALHEFSPTDPDWPTIMRINPILNWTYRDVWYYLLSRKVTYCSLYDRGYTSLGSMMDTRPNPSLSTCQGNYRPAYELLDPNEERRGRSIS